jgi:cysteinyl-tRNA synthetase
MTVSHVRNLTNVDDKTIRESTAAGRTLVDFTEVWTERFHEDCRALHLLKPGEEPGAVENIPEQITLITKLVASDHAYAREGSVYFRVASFPAYGRLSRLDQRELLTTTTTAGDSDEYSRESASDFVLWKARKPEDGENFWPSPWGEGRPGWHIECSAMSLKFLGPNFDLHGGGSDLIFPHHENEIAQSEAATGQPFARVWMHVEHLMVDGRKMSKSLGNLYTLKDAADRGFKPLDIRYALLSGHYRKPLNFTWDSVSAAASALAKLEKFGRKLQLNAPVEPSQQPSDFATFAPAWEALCDDLNTPEALGRIFSILPKASESIDTSSKTEVARLAHEFSRILRALGLEHLLRESLPQHLEVPPEIQTLADKRWEARLSKDWAAADALRKDLATRGWAMKDGKDGFTLSTENAPAG